MNICSFCGKEHAAVAVLIVTASKTGICDKCVDACAKIVEEQRNHLFLKSIFEKVS